MSRKHRNPKDLMCTSSRPRGGQIWPRRWPVGRDGGQLAVTGALVRVSARFAEALLFHTVAHEAVGTTIPPFLTWISPGVHRIPTARVVTWNDDGAHLVVLATRRAAPKSRRSPTFALFASMKRPPNVRCDN